MKVKAPPTCMDDALLVVVVVVLLLVVLDPSALTQALVLKLGAELEKTTSTHFKKVRKSYTKRYFPFFFLYLIQ